MVGFLNRFVFVICFLITSHLWGQRVPISFTTDLSTIIASEGQTPFWLRTNKWGIVPLNTPSSSLQLGISRPYKTTDSLHKPLWDWGFSVNAVGNLVNNPIGSSTSSLLLPEAYIKVRLGRIELWGGRRQQIIGLVDTLLSSGSYVVSGNTLPIPQLQLALPDFVPIGWLDNVIAVKGNYTYGWFNAPYIQGVKLHQKAVFLRVGRPTSLWHVILGINHEVQWSGHADYLRDSPFAINGSLTSSFSDYVKSVVLGLIPRDIGNVRYTSFDAANRIGNHLGSMDLGLRLTRSNASWLLYHQHPYEDASGLSWRNMPDGLYGIRWQRHQTTPTKRNFWQWQHFVGEILITTDQSGPYFSAPGQSYKGADNYYNHSQYREGWSYFGQTVGTPFLTPRHTLSSSSQAGDFYFPNNRVIVYYGAFELLMNDLIQIQGRLSFSRNFGSYASPFSQTEPQFSGMLATTLPLSKTGNKLLSLTIAADQGQLLPNRLGMRIGFHRTW